MGRGDGGGIDMGMFDSVYVTCPKCGDEIEFQTKVGDRCLASYTLEDAPPDIMAGVAGDTGHCRCGEAVELAVMGTTVRHIVVPVLSARINQ